MSEQLFIFISQGVNDNHEQHRSIHVIVINVLLIHMFTFCGKSPSGNGFACEPYRLRELVCLAHAFTPHDSLTT